jgi:adenylosuccinate synthase
MGLFRGPEVNHEYLHRWLQISRRALWVFSVFNYNEDKGWGYRTSQMSSIFTLDAMAISNYLTRINEIQGHNFSIFSDSRSMMTAISPSKNFGKRSPLISHT